MQNFMWGMFDVGPITPLWCPFYLQPLMAMLKRFGSGLGSLSALVTLIIIDISVKEGVVAVMQ